MNIVLQDSGDDKLLSWSADLDLGHFCKVKNFTRGIFQAFYTLLTIFKVANDIFPKTLLNMYSDQQPISLIASGKDSSILLQHFEEGRNLRRQES